MSSGNSALDELFERWSDTFFKLNKYVLETIYEKRYELDVEEYESMDYLKKKDIVDEYAETVKELGDRVCNIIIMMNQFVEPFLGYGFDEYIYQKIVHYISKAEYLLEKLKYEFDSNEVVEYEMSPTTAAIFQAMKLRSEIVNGKEEEDNYDYAKVISSKSEINNSVSAREKFKEISKKKKDEINKKFKPLSSIKKDMNKWYEDIEKIKQNFEVTKEVRINKIIENKEKIIKAAELKKEKKVKEDIKLNECSILEIEKEIKIYNQDIDKCKQELYRFSFFQIVKKDKLKKEIQKMNLSINSKIERLSELKKELEDKRNKLEKIKNKCKKEIESLNKNRGKYEEFLRLITYTYESPFANYEYEKMLMFDTESTLKYEKIKKKIMNYFFYKKSENELFECTIDEMKNDEDELVDYSNQTLAALLIPLIVNDSLNKNIINKKSYFSLGKRYTLEDLDFNNKEMKRYEEALKEE